MNWEDLCEPQRHRFLPCLIIPICLLPSLPLNSVPHLRQKEEMAVLKMPCHLHITPEAFFKRPLPLQSHLRKGFNRTMEYKFRLQSLSHVSLLCSRSSLHVFVAVSFRSGQVLIICFFLYKKDYEIEQEWGFRVRTPGFWFLLALVDINLQDLVP